MATTHPRRSTARPVPGADSTGRRPALADAASWDETAPTPRSAQTSPTSTSSATKRLNVNLDAPLHQQLRVWTAIHDTDISAVIRVLVEVLVGEDPARTDLRSDLAALLAPK